MRKRCQYQIAPRVEIVWGKQLSCRKGYSQEKLRDFTVLGSLIAISAGKEINYNVPMTPDSRPPKIGVIIYVASGIKIEKQPPPSSLPALDFSYVMGKHTS